MYKRKLTTYIRMKEVKVEFSLKSNSFGRMSMVLRTTGNSLTGKLDLPPPAHAWWKVLSKFTTLTFSRLAKCILYNHVYLELTLVNQIARCTGTLPAEYAANASSIESVETLERVVFRAPYHESQLAYLALFKVSLTFGPLSLAKVS